METSLFPAPVWAIKHSRPSNEIRICRIYSANLLLKWKGTNFCMKSSFEYQKNTKWKHPYLIRSIIRYTNENTSELEIRNCVSNPSSPGVSALSPSDTVQPFPDIESLETTGEESEYEDWDRAVLVEDVKMLLKLRSKHNFIRVLEVSRRADHPLAGARLLLLDKPGNIHSILFKYKILTHSYYDVFATVPPLLPHGTLGILGMGAGTTAHLLLHFWPSIEIQGWELDPTVISVGRKYFDLLQLERAHQDKLVVHIGDALEANIPGGFSGIVVDLFSEGVVIPELQRPSTWKCLKDRLRDGGRIMVNCGGRRVEAESPSRDGHMVMQETLGALAEVFPREVFVLRLGYDKEDSSIALTGPLPDLQAWKQSLPPCLRRYVNKWVPV